MMKIEILKALTDNYIYVIESGESFLIVDPGEVGPVFSWAKRTGKKPTHVLLTHHHSDHTGGADMIRTRFGVRIIGAAGDAHRLPKLDLAVNDGDEIPLGESVAKIIAIPGHTLGHIGYWFKAENRAFVGDTLFSLGCGKVLEGTPEMLWQSISRIKAMPPETRLYCGHEYTLVNAQFALTLDRDNMALRERLIEASARAEKGYPTMPTTLAVELAANPFLRTDQPNIAAAVYKPDGTPEEVFIAMRRKKDGFG